MKGLAAALTVAVLLSGCASSSPEATLQMRVNALVSAANAGDSAALRAAGSLLLKQINDEESQADLGSAKARALTSLVNRILANAGQLDQVEPTPTPSAAEPTPSATPTPTPSPSRESAPPSAEPPPSSAPPPVVPSLIVGSQSPQPSPSQS